MTHVLPPLRVHPNRRLLEAGSRPFFWLADTAWSLLYRLSEAEVMHYLDVRRSQGFNVIQTMLVHEVDGLGGNLEGQAPFLEHDPSRPNEAFFRRVDRIFDLATERGFYLAVNALWGNFVARHPRYPHTVIVDADRALEYGRYLGRRYAGHSNLVWLLGGDRPPVYEGGDDRPVWRALAQGLRETMPGALQTYHPDAHRASTLPLRQEETLDFLMYQSGHGRRNQPVWAWLEEDAAVGKPMLDGEPAYEDHGVDPWEPHFLERREFFRALEVRQMTYRSVFAGGCGVTYGHHAVWQAYDPARHAQPIYFADRPWQQALSRPGAYQMGFLRRLLESRPLAGRVPDQTLWATHPGHAEDHARACRDEGGRYAMVYAHGAGRPLRLNLSSLCGERLRAWWFEPRSGGVTLIGEPERRAVLEWVTPLHSPDWVLVLDDAEALYGPPGAVAYPPTGSS